MIMDEPAVTHPKPECALAHHLFQIMWDLRREARHICKPLGLSPTMFYLVDLIKLGYSQPKELASRMHIVGPALSAMISELKARDVVVSLQDEQDARYRILSLTPAGEALHQQVADAWQVQVVTRYSHLGRDKVKALLAILDEVSGQVPVWGSE